MINQETFNAKVSKCHFNLKVKTDLRLVCSENISSIQMLPTVQTAASRLSNRFHYYSTRCDIK